MDKLELDISRSALLMIDMQKGFLDPNSSLYIAGAPDTIPTCARVLASARGAGMPVVHIRREYAFDGSDVEPVRRKIWLDGGRPLCREGSDPSSIDAPPELTACEGELVLIKPRFSAFFQTNLHNLLQRRGIDTIVLIGTTTPNCIRTTCYDALSLNYNVIVIEDATSSRTVEVQRANIEDMRFIGATVLSAHEFAIDVTNSPNVTPPDLAQNSCYDARRRTNIIKGGSHGQKYV